MNFDRFRDLFVCMVAVIILVCFFPFFTVFYVSLYLECLERDL